MDKPLAKLILSNREKALPYLILRSQYVLSGKVSVADAETLVGRVDLDDLKVSGIVEVEDGTLVFERDGKWLIQPSLVPRNKEQRSNFSKQIERIANIVGIPADFYLNEGKYRSLYSRLLGKGYTFDYIETIAYDNEGIGLNKLFTESVFETCVRKFENARR